MSDYFIHYPLGSIWKAKGEPQEDNHYKVIIAHGARNVDAYGYTPTLVLDTLGKPDDVKIIMDLLEFQGKYAMTRRIRSQGFGKGKY